MHPHITKNLAFLSSQTVESLRNIILNAETGQFMSKINDNQEGSKTGTILHISPLVKISHWKSIFKIL